MQITKSILDDKVSKHEEDVTHDLTFREYIRELENEFELENEDLDNMTDEELNKYDEWLWELTLK